jgi:hypothetical protein|tara:strand:+ start:590 stop:1297 length:708 start_codon:yes stop_codon:yes gene_type:complete
MENKNKHKELTTEKPDETGGVRMEGHILIRDITDEEEPVELVNKRNAIHFGNMAKHLAQTLAGKANYDIHYMGFGNGGSNVNTLGKITYKTTNVSEAPDYTSPTSNLYALKYFKVVDDLAASNTATSKNKIEVLPSSTSYTDIKVTCTLEFGEPSVQSNFDNSTDFMDDFVFDELGLFSLDVATGNEIAGTATDAATILDFNSKCYMLTHVIFHPIQKSLNRIIEIVYTIRIQMQ